MAARISSYIGRRRDARLRIRKGVPAQVMTLDGPLNGSMFDLSQSGAHLAMPAPLRAGQEVVLWWLGFEAFGKVVWTSDLEAGVEFYDMLAPAILLQTRDQVDLGLAPTSDQAAYDHARNWYFGRR